MGLVLTHIGQVLVLEPGPYLSWTMELVLTHPGQVLVLDWSLPT
jgi:hypothetical protein